jgi:hypothetical protein
MNYTKPPPIPAAELGSVAVELHTSDFRGDHAASVVQAHRLKDGETVLMLVDRLLQLGDYSPSYGRGNVTPDVASDFIVLRLRAEPVEPPSAEPPVASPWPL